MVWWLVLNLFPVCGLPARRAARVFLVWLTKLNSDFFFFPSPPFPSLPLPSPLLSSKSLVDKAIYVQSIASTWITVREATGTPKQSSQVNWEQNREWAQLFCNYWECLPFNTWTDDLETDKLEVKITSMSKGFHIFMHYKEIPCLLY